MRGLIIFVLVAGGLYWGGKTLMESDSQLSLDSLIDGGPTRAAEKRVKQILEGLKTEGDGNGFALQAAICQWDRAVDTISDQGEFEGAYDGFSAFRDSYNMNYRKIKSYTITSSEVVQEKPPVVMVSGTIENKPFKWRVPYKERISAVRLRSYY
jgi:hypothetical protein